MNKLDVKDTYWFVIKVRAFIQIFLKDANLILFAYERRMQ